ncbi:MAG: hypothetical protein ACOYOU_14960 [Kiritimatiellia bacterium]
MIDNDRDKDRDEDGIAVGDYGGRSAFALRATAEANKVNERTLGERERATRTDNELRVFQSSTALVARYRQPKRRTHEIASTEQRV